MEREHFISIYTQRTPKSKELFERAKKVLPGGVSYAIRYFEPYPFYVTKAKGSKVWDVDGNEYTDYWMGHGAIIMGHAYPPVIKAIQEQAEIGTHLGFAHEWEIKHAEQISKMIPSAEMVRPTNSGTEANMYCIRLARAYTGRKKIAKFEGGWHGGYDALHKGTSYPFDAPASLGLHEGLLSDTILLPFNDIEGVERKVKEIKEELACIIIEPVIGAGGFIPAEKEFLKRLRELCDEIGSLLIFDEVITGFRLAPGGAQEYYRVEPDLTVLGKIVGGSVLPAGAFCGKSEIMKKIDQTIYKKGSERSFHGGTYAGNPLVARAGYTLLKELDERKDEIYPRLNSLGEKMRKGLHDVFSRSNISAYVTGLGSLFGIHFTKEEPKDVASANKTKDVRTTLDFFYFMLSKKIIYFSPDVIHCTISYSHSEKEIDEFIEYAEEFVKLKK